MELRCLAPEGIPPPDVTWQKNGVAVEPKKEGSNLIVSSEGHLLVVQARLADMGNYTCVSENVAGKRISDTAVLTVLGTYHLILEDMTSETLKTGSICKRHLMMSRERRRRLYLRMAIDSTALTPNTMCYSLWRNRLEFKGTSCVKLSSSHIHHAIQFLAHITLGQTWSVFLLFLQELLFPFWDFPELIYMMSKRIHTPFDSAMLFTA